MQVPSRAPLLFFFLIDKRKLTEGCEKLFKKEKEKRRRS
jgi:predicted PurR-regulated permease PerM